jgi:hypothetical protein
LDELSERGHFGIRIKNPWPEQIITVLIRNHLNEKRVDEGSLVLKDLFPKITELYDITIHKNLQYIMYN